MRRARPTRRRVRQEGSQEAPATCPKAAAAPRPGTAMCAGPRRRSRRRRRRRAELDRRARARRATRCWSRRRSGPRTQQHACLEPHAAVARFDGDRLTVHVSTQAVFRSQEQIAKRFKLAHDKVRVDRRSCRRRLRLQGQPWHRDDRRDRARARGQGAGACRLRPARRTFGHGLSAGGGDEDRAIAVPPTARSRRCRSPRMPTPALPINSTLAALARLIYPAEAKELVDYDVISNLPPGAPFRGPGGPPMAFALEQAIDEAALRMKVDPIGLRKRWDPNPNRQRLYDWAAGLDVWRNRKPAAVANRPLPPRRRRRQRATGFISGSRARPSNSRSRAAASSQAARRRTSAPGTRSVHRQHRGEGVRAGAA